MSTQNTPHNETKNLGSTEREEFLKSSHYEILMQMNYFLYDLQNQKSKRSYIDKKMKIIRRMCCDLIPPEEVLKRGNKTLTRDKVEKMQSSRKTKSRQRKIEFDKLLSELRCKSTTMHEIFTIPIASRQSIRNFIAGRAVPNETFLVEFRKVVETC
jgi:hypothetical protein